MASSFTVGSGPAAERLDVADRHKQDRESIDGAGFALVPHNGGVNLSAIAAFTAAGLSLINVLISGRLTRRGQVDQWRRDTERPIIARILTLSDNSLVAGEDLAAKRERWINSLGQEQAEEIEAREAMHDAFESGWKIFEDLRYQSAELDLVAGEAVRDTVHNLVGQHESIYHVLRPASGADDYYDAFIRYRDQITLTCEQVVRKARIDLRVDSRLRRHH